MATGGAIATAAGDSAPLTAPIGSSSAVPSNSTAAGGVLFAIFGDLASHPLVLVIVLLVLFHIALLVWVVTTMWRQQTPNGKVAGYRKWSVVGGKYD